MSYIVKNCPAYSTFYPDTGAEPFTACDAELPLKKCHECTDCVIKQVIEKLKNPNNRTYGGRPLVFTDELLQLFNLEDINK